MLEYSSFGEEGVRALARAISLAKGQNPLQTVTVAVSSPVAALHLRRRLPMVAGRGLVNVRFLPLARAAELIGAPLLQAGQKPLTPPMSAEILRLLLDRDESVFTPVKSHPSTVDTLLRTFADLEGANPDELTALASRGVRQSAVVNLFTLYRQEVDRRAFYMREDLFRAAAQAVRQKSSALDELGRVILFFPGMLKSHEAAFLRGLASLDSLHVILPVGHPETQQANRRILQLLNLSETPSQFTAQTPGATHLYSVPDAEEEVRQALRILMERLSRGVPLYRMAILFRSREPYARICYEECLAAGVPCNGQSVRTLAETMAGRATLGLLTLRQSQFHREDFLNWVGASPVKLASGEIVPGASWQQVSRLAGITRGLNAWKRGLERIIREKSIPRESSEDATISAKDQEIIQAAEALLLFLLQLNSDLDYKPQDTWENYAHQLLELLEKYLASSAHPVWDETELANLENVRSSIESLAGLHAIRESIPFSDFAVSVEKSLQNAAGRVGSYGTGIFIGTFDEAAAMDFDLACILGMAEGSVPALKSRQPLLTDDDKAEAGGTLASPFSPLERERQRYLAALGTAKESILFYPRSNPEGGKENLPSRWLLEAAGALAERPVTGEDLAEGITGDWFTFLASYQSAILSQPPFSPAEYRVGSLLRHLRSGRDPESHFIWNEGTLRKTVGMYTSGRVDCIGSWDGRVQLSGPVLGERPVAPTRLETFARCPYQFFLKHVLGVEEIEDAEDRLTMDPRVRGSLYHDVLAEFFGRYIGRDPQAAWGDEHKAEIESIARQHLDRLERDGLCGPALLWEDESAAVIAYLQRFLDYDSIYRLQNGAVPQLLEADFGTNPVVSIKCEGKEVRFRGRPDRVDSSPGGSAAFVIDYKTGSPQGTVRERSSDPFLKGCSLQLPVYACAAREMLPDTTQASARYLHLLQDKDVEQVEIAMTPDKVFRFEYLLSALVSTIENGLFPANPGDASNASSFENCRYCRYDRICPKDRDKIWQAKSKDPQISRYVALGEQPETNQEESEE